MPSDLEKRHALVMRVKEEVVSYVRAVEHTPSGSGNYDYDMKKFESSKPLKRARLKDVKKVDACLRQAEEKNVSYAELDRSIKELAFKIKGSFDFLFGHRARLRRHLLDATGRAQQSHLQSAPVPQRRSIPNTSADEKGNVQEQMIVAIRENTELRKINATLLTENNELRKTNVELNLRLVTLLEENERLTKTVADIVTQYKEMFSQSTAEQAHVKASDANQLTNQQMMERIQQMRAQRSAPTNPPVLVQAPILTNSAR